MVKKVAIVGAGPSGVLLAHYLLRRQKEYQIDIYERRSDPRITSFSKSRTFPITLSERGINALSKIEGLLEAVKSMGVEITGTVIHQKKGKMRLMSRKKPLLAIDRTTLVIALLNNLTEKYNNSRLNLYFNHNCTQVNLPAKTITFQKVTEEASSPLKTDITVNYDLLIGADGARSIVRGSLIGTESFDCQEKYVPSEYKSIFLPRPDEKLAVFFPSGKIHSWRTKDGTSVLLLNQPDGTMSGVIIFPAKKNKVVTLSTKEELFNYFHQNFPEVAQLMPESEAEALLQRPVSRVLTIRCSRYHYNSSVLLIGDAAHSVSPSIGQGCNAALEDVVIFDGILDQYADNLEKAIEQFTVCRKADGHALVELGDNAFPLSKGLFIQFILRQQLIKALRQFFPKSFSPSMMVLISDTNVPYSEILNLYRNWISKVKKSNDKFLERL